jgi:hypothetical protein
LSLRCFSGSNQMRQLMRHNSTVSGWSAQPSCGTWLYHSGSGKNRAAWVKSLSRTRVRYCRIFWGISCDEILQVCSIADPCGTGPPVHLTKASALFVHRPSPFQRLAFKGSASSSAEEEDNNVEDVRPPIVEERLPLHCENDVDAAPQAGVGLTVVRFCTLVICFLGRQGSAVKRAGGGRLAGFPCSACGTGKLCHFQWDVITGRS